MISITPRANVNRLRTRLCYARGLGKLGRLNISHGFNLLKCLNIDLADLVFFFYS